MKISPLGQLLLNSRWVRLIELIGLFVLAMGFILAVEPFVEGSALLFQSLVWVANVLMILYVWAGLRLRGQGWNHIGLTKHPFSRSQLLRTFLLSLLVFVIAIAAFLIGAIIMANITGMPKQADTSEYAFLQGNLPMLLLILVGVFFVSSFGEEVVYRGFLINRIEELGTASKTWTMIAVIISAVVFGLAHYSWGITGIVQTTFMGLALALMYLRLNRRLWINVIAHAYMDAILMIQMYFS